MSLKPCLVCLLFFDIIDSQFNCTSISADTCFIDRTTSLNANNRQNITCSQSTAHCDISCNERDSCSTNILCPSDGASCTIHCNSRQACSDANVVTSNCDNVYINIDSNTQNMSILAPDDGGSLFMNISSSGNFLQNSIHSHPNTNNIVINCDGDCSQNTINTANIATLSIDCSTPTAQCNKNTIYCPIHCNILCRDCLDTRSIIPSTGAIDDIEWICTADCSNSSLYQDTTRVSSWYNCLSDGWVLSPSKECDDIVYSTRSPIVDDDDDANQSVVTILAFVLIGTVIGCLCVILVTTIICCICWHESQIKALNMKQKEQQYNGDHHTATHNNVEHIISNEEQTPPSSLPVDDSNTPAPNSYSMGGSLKGPPQARTRPPNTQEIKKNKVTSPHNRRYNNYKRDHVVYQAAPQETRVSSSGEEKQVRSRKSSKNSKHTNSNHRRMSGKNSNQKTRSKSPPKQKQKHSAKKKKRVETHDFESAEADDYISPLRNDRIGNKYDEDGRYDKYRGRKEHKERIRMELAAFPSNISAGTTGTAEMMFVGTNYREYNPAEQNNSYFKEEDGYEHTATSGVSTTGLSLGNLNSQTTTDDGATTTTSTEEPLTPTTVTSVTSTAITSPDMGVSFKKYGGHQQHYQGHQQQNVREKIPKKRNIPIIAPLNAGQKVKQHRQYQQQHQHHNQHHSPQHEPQNFESPTLTYQSPDY